VYHIICARDPAGDEEQKEMMYFFLAGALAFLLWMKWEVDHAMPDPNEIDRDYTELK